MNTSRILSTARPEDAEGRAVRSKRNIAVVLVTLSIAVLVALAVVAVTRYWKHGRFIESTDDAYVAADSTIIAPKVSGYVTEVDVDDNQQVHAGQLLARIDERDYRVALQNADADGEIANAQLATAQAKLDMQSSIVKQSDAAVVGAQALSSISAINRKRDETLAGTGYGSLQNAQESSARARESAANLLRLQAAARTSRQQIEEMRAEVAEARGRLAHAQAVHSKADLDLQHTSLVSAISGVVGRRTVRVGQMVQPGNALMAVVPLHQVYVVANFKETQLTRMSPGQAVTIHVDTFPDDDIAGHIDSLSPASGLEFALLPSDNATGNFTKIVQRIPVKILLDQPNRKNRLRPGMSVEADVDTSRSQTQKS